MTYKAVGKQLSSKTLPDISYVIDMICYANKTTVLEEVKKKAKDQLLARIFISKLICRLIAEKKDKKFQEFSLSKLNTVYEIVKLK